MKKEGWLIRTSGSDEGTFGHLCVGDKHWHIGELPDRDNKPDISRILAGDYIAKHRADGKHGECYELQDVYGRTVIQIHVANYFGDKLKKFVSDVLGCIGPGKGRAKAIPTRKGKPISDKKQEMITSSGKAMKEFLAYMKKEDLILHVIDYTPAESGA